MANVLARRFGRNFVRIYERINSTTKNPCTTLMVRTLGIDLHYCNFCRKSKSTNRLLATPKFNYLRCYSTEECKPKKERDEHERVTTQKPSLFQRFKQMYRDYWYVLVPVHLVTSAAWFGGFYYLAKSGVDIPGWLESMQFNERLVNSMRDSSMGYYAVAYALYKIATPARYTVTLGGTTISIQYLTKWGYIKPVPSKERLKEIYQETKEGIKEKKDSLIETVKEKKGSVIETVKEKKDDMFECVKETTQEVKAKTGKLLGTDTRRKRNRCHRVKIKNKKC